MLYIMQDKYKRESDVKKINLKNQSESPTPSVKQRSHHLKNIYLSDHGLGFLNIEAAGWKKKNKQKTTLYHKLYFF